jgi:hypothetical protein
MNFGGKRDQDLRHAGIELQAADNKQIDVGLNWEP